MGRIVIDKSVTYAGRTNLETVALGHSIALTAPLLYELCTDTLDRWETLGESEKASVVRRNTCRIRTVLSAFGTRWDFGDRECDFGTPEMLDAQACLTLFRQVEPTFTELSSITTDPRDEPQKKKLQDISDEKTFYEAVLPEYRCWAERKGKSDSPYRRCLGIVAAIYVPVAAWSEKHQPLSRDANLILDLWYVAFEGMCDGIVSGDKLLLKIAWGCWPEKRAHVYHWDTCTHMMTAFCPQWSTSIEPRA